MGCDIHWLKFSKTIDGNEQFFDADECQDIERDNEYGFDWLKTLDDRNYGFFGLLSGVRFNNENPVGILEQSKKMNDLPFELDIQSIIGNDEYYDIHSCTIVSLRNLLAELVTPSKETEKYLIEMNKIRKYGNFEHYITPIYNIIQLGYNYAIVAYDN